MRGFLSSPSPPYPPPLPPSPSPSSPPLAECLEQVVIDAADDAQAVVRAIGKNRAASALASDAMNRAAVGFSRPSEMPGLISR